MITRRDFAVRTAAVTTLASLPGCVFSNIYKTISTYVPVALVAFDRIIAILVEHGVNTSTLAEAIDRVKAALADIQSAVLEYQDAHRHDKETLIHAIALALKIASERLHEFWELLKIPNEQLARAVKVLIDIIISTLTGFSAQLAPGTPVGAQRFVSEPKARTVREFKRDFNRALDAAGESKFAI